MNVTLNIATLAHRPGDTVDVSDELAADLIAGGHAVAIIEPAEAVEPEVVETPPRRRGGKADDTVEPTTEP